VTRTRKRQKKKKEGLPMFQIHQRRKRWGRIGLWRRKDFLGTFSNGEDGKQKELYLSEMSIVGGRTGEGRTKPGL